MRQVVGLMGLRGSGKDTAAEVLVAAGWRRLAFADALYKEVAEAFSVTVPMLQERRTKEVPQGDYSLAHCRDERFIEVVMKWSIIHAIRDKAEQAKLKAKGLEAPAFLVVWGLRKLQQALATFRYIHLGGAVPMGRELAELTKPRSPRELLQYWGTEYRRVLDGDDYWRRQVADELRRNPDINAVITDVRFPDEARVLEKEFGGHVFRVRRPAQEGKMDMSLLHISEQAMLNWPATAVFVNEDAPDGLAKFKGKIATYFLGDAAKTAA